MPPPKQLPKQLLVVDDDSMVRMLIPALLRERNFEIEQASDGDEALEKLREKKYDVIVLDLMMPRVDGFEVLQYIESKTPDRLKKTIVLTALTGSAFPGVDESTIFKLVHKPFKMKELIALVLECAGQ